MAKPVFDHTDYKAYLLERLEEPDLKRGGRSRVAEHLRCHVTYVSQVLNAHSHRSLAHFSLEQAQSLNVFLSHGEDESDFFLLLVHHARSGTKALRDYYSAKLKAIRERRSVLKNRLDYAKQLGPEQQSTYFSAWYYAAIHLLLMAPECRTRDRIAAKLGLPATRVSRVLDFLVENGLAVEAAGTYKVGPVSIHLGNDTAMISKHHTNWRLQALQSLEHESPEDLHYSSAVVIARKDVPAIREELVRAVEKVRGLVKESPEEELYCYAIDLFKVGRPVSGRSS